MNFNLVALCTSFRWAFMPTTHFWIGGSFTCFFFFFFFFFFSMFFNGHGHGHRHFTRGPSCEVDPERYPSFRRTAQEIWAQHGLLGFARGSLFKGHLGCCRFFNIYFYYYLFLIYIYINKFCVMRVASLFTLRPINREPQGLFKRQIVFQDPPSLSSMM